MVHVCHCWPLEGQGNESGIGVVVSGGLMCEAGL